MLEDAVFPGATYTFIDKEKMETRLIGSAAILPEREVLREGMLYDVASLTKVIVTTTLLLQLCMKKGKSTLKIRCERICRHSSLAR